MPPSVSRSQEYGATNCPTARGPRGTRFHYGPLTSPPGKLGIADSAGTCVFGRSPASACLRLGPLQRLCSRMTPKVMSEVGGMGEVDVLKALSTSAHSAPPD